MTPQTAAVIWCGFDVLLLWPLVHFLLEGKREWLLTLLTLVVAAVLVSDIVYAVSLSKALHP